MEEENTTFCGRCAESFRSCGRFLYNSDEGTVLGRTGKSWALIGLFYLIFYSALAGFFAGMLAVFLNTVIEAERPKLTGDQSLLKLTPGLSFFPLPNYKSTLIKFNVKDKLSYAKYTADIDSKLSHIKTSSKKPDDGYAKCNPTTDTKEPNDPNEVCKFKTNHLGPCMENDYGFKINKPCIFIKMNKIYGWIPNVQENITNPYVECRGETKADQEIIGPLKYFPEMEVNKVKYGKISNIFFPYLNQRAYVAPVAAIQFEKLPPNIMVMVRCSLLGLVSQSHSVRLEIVMDNLDA